MEIEKLVPALAMVVIVLLIARHPIQGIYRNIKEGRRLRKIRKNTPGPLLGVVFPKDKKD
jgi:hypothetical protein